METTLRATNCIDYLSHDNGWSPSSIHRCYLGVSRALRSPLPPSEYSHYTRLHNAIWRRYARLFPALGGHNRLINPRYINWQKDHDVTWLLGPFYETLSRDEGERSRPGPSASISVPPTEPSAKEEVRRSVCKTVRDQETKRLRQASERLGHLLFPGEPRKLRFSSEVACISYAPTSPTREVSILLGRDVAAVANGQGDSRKSREKLTIDKRAVEEIVVVEEGEEEEEEEEENKEEEEEDRETEESWSSDEESDDGEWRHVNVVRRVRRRKQWYKVEREEMGVGEQWDRVRDSRGIVRNIGEVLMWCGTVLHSGDVEHAVSIHGQVPGTRRVYHDLLLQGALASNFRFEFVHSFSNLEEYVYPEPLLPTECQAKIPDPAVTLG
ncbi:uncharacterized protein VTP21DRAFT_878 [Calcarisporiella thermophila]|uniref:uncharacterized protein n=1 Tax=Calcarisporiella thermophila TaxID=911321 RepID=UPI003742F5C7